MSHNKLFYELGNLDVAKKLFFNFDKIEIDFDENDKYKNKKSQKSILRGVLDILNSNKPTTYHHTPGKKSGRVYSKGGFQFLKRSLRNAICGNLYKDCDMKNAQPVCLLNLCEKANLNVPVLKEYCVNRDNYYPLKQNVIEILYGGALPENINETEKTFLTDFKQEVSKIHNFMIKNTDYQQLVKTITVKQKKEVEQNKRQNLNIGGALCASILQDLENNCLQCALEYIISKDIDIKNFVLMFDGFMIPSNLFYDTLLDEVNQFVLEKTGIPVQYVEKPMTDVFVVPLDWIYDEKELKKRETDEWYKLEKVKFEEKVSRINYPEVSYLEQLGDRIELSKKETMAERYSHINFKGSYFFNIWKDDPTKRQYDRIDFLPPPKVCPANYYNLWNGFEIENALNPETDIGETTFKKVVSVIANNNIEMETFIFNIAAHIIQRPAEQLPISLVCVGLEGTGKNVFGEIMKSLIGKKYSFETADLENEVFCRFKYNLMNKLFLIINEADPDQTFKYEQKLKHFIGNGKTQSIEMKGKTPIDMEIYFFILMISNNMNCPVKITPTDRRYVVTETSDERRCDEVFWGNVIDTFKQPENVKGLFNYLKSFPITVKNWSMSRPKTQIYQKITSYCFDSTIKILRKLILIEWNKPENISRFTNQEIITLCDIDEDRLSFFTKLGQKTIDGIVTKRTPSSRGWVIDRQMVYDWLKKNKYIFENECLKQPSNFQETENEVETDF